jgi:hypothetical protein
MLLVAVKPLVLAVLAAAAEAVAAASAAQAAEPVPLAAKQVLLRCMHLLWLQTQRLLQQQLLSVLLALQSSSMRSSRHRSRLCSSAQQTIHLGQLPQMLQQRQQQQRRRLAGCLCVLARAAPAQPPA